MGYRGDGSVDIRKGLPGFREVSEEQNGQGPACRIAFLDENRNRKKRLLMKGLSVCVAVGGGGGGGGGGSRCG